MNATILPFKRVQKPKYSTLAILGLAAENPGPSLEEMCATLRKNYAVLDETDRSFLFLITKVSNQGDKAKIETVMECLAIAWSMLNRYRLQT